jgi:hypothetical protein
MTRALLISVLLLSSLDLDAAGRRRAVNTSHDDSIHVKFEVAEGGDGMLDSGVISQATDDAGRRGESTVTRRFGVRLEGAAGSGGTFATLLAFVENPDPNMVVKLNGITLTATPVVVDPQVRVGSLRQHTLQLTVPVDAPEGMFQASIGWQVITD